jgi:hypothetical protein
MVMSYSCGVCNSKDVKITFVKRNSLIDSSSFHRVDNEFISASEYDYYYKLTAAKDHILCRCNVCEKSSRVDIEEGKECTLHCAVLPNDEIRHSKSCPNYEGSLTEVCDKLSFELEGLKEETDHGTLICTKSLINEHGIQCFTEGKQYKIYCVGSVDMAMEIVILSDHHIVTTYIIEWPNPDQEIFDEHFKYIDED